MPFTPLLYLLERLLAEGGAPNVQQIITAGEQVQTTPLLLEFFRRHPDCRLHSHYGPTECYVVTAHALDPAPDG